MSGIQKGPADIKMSARLIELNGKKFVAGLNWWALSSASAPQKEAAEQAKRDDMNLSTIYSGATFQAGFANIPQGLLKEFNGAWCLASVLASKLGKNWLGAFRLDDGNFAIMAVQDGRIVPGCDEVGDFDSISDLLVEVGAYAWEKVYIADPRMAAAFEEHLLDKSTLKDILIEKKWDSSYKVKTIGGGVDPKIFLISGVVVLLGLSFFGYRFYSNLMFEREVERITLMEQQEQMQREQSDKQKAQQVVDERTIKPSWPNEPFAAAIMDACQANIKRVELSIAGWLLDEVTCTPGAVSANYIRKPGSVMQDFADQATSMKASGNFDSFSVQADTATIRIAQPGLMRRGPEDLVVYAPWAMQWGSHFQRIGVVATLDIQPHPEPAPPEATIVTLLGKENAVPPPPWWNTYRWTFNSESLNAFEVLKSRVGPGFVLKKIVLKTSSHASWKWSAEGEVHVLQ